MTCCCTAWPCGHDRVPDRNVLNLIWLSNFQGDAMRRVSSWVVGAWLVLASQVVMASDAVTDAIQDANQPYREALFSTNSKAQVEAEQAIDQVRKRWNTLIERYAANPPVPYDRDGKFVQTLNQVNAIFGKASKEIHEQALVKAHDTLEDARDLMAELRKRNGVIVFSDHMNAYHIEMERILNVDAEKLADSGAMMRLMSQVGTLGYLAQKLESEAPGPLSNNPEFKKLVAAVQQSVAALRDAVLNQDAPAIGEALKKLKGPYSKMFQKFG